MELLVTGLMLFTVPHLLLALAAPRVAQLRVSLGEKVVKGIVSLPVGLGLLLMVLGWRSSQPQWLYLPPAGLRGVAFACIVLGIYLFVVANRRSRLKRILRHPQLTGLMLWAIGHLLLNGDSRSLLLFGTLAVWAPLEMFVINVREGPRVRPEAPGIGTDVVTVVIAAVAIVSLTFAHPWLAGVPAIAP